MFSEMIKVNFFQSHSSQVSLLICNSLAACIEFRHHHGRHYELGPQEPIPASSSSSFPFFYNRVWDTNTHDPSASPVVRGGHVTSASQWYIWGSYCCHFQESNIKGQDPLSCAFGLLCLPSFFFLWDVSMIRRDAAAILEHEVTSLRLMTWPGMEEWKREGSWVPEHLSAPKFIGEWSKQCLYLFNYNSSAIMFSAARSIVTWCHHFRIRKIKSLFLLISKWELLCFNFNFFLCVASQGSTLGL